MGVGSDSDDMRVKDVEITVDARSWLHKYFEEGNLHYGFAVSVLECLRLK